MRSAKRVFALLLALWFLLPNTALAQNPCRDLRATEGDGAAGDCCAAFADAMFYLGVYEYGGWEAGLGYWSAGYVGCMHDTFGP